MTRVEKQEYMKSLMMRLMRKRVIRLMQAHRFKVLNGVIRFGVNGLLFQGVVEIEINDNQDGYNIILFNRLNTIENVFCDVDGSNLAKLLYANIENPLDGRYFNLVKKYAKRKNMLAH